ncbi:MAG: hypothetical protein D9C04_04510 [Nitrosopumilus sp. B06]|nr:MAG: hypothetical protein EB828_00510 [Nitrosopumilus sp. D6]RNJ79480.1 MAG: hypothetical protein D9C04_04510 [Nitrosopumilus sp. B06]
MKSDQRIALYEYNGMLIDIQTRALTAKKDIRMADRFAKSTSADDSAESKVMAEECEYINSLDKL